MNPTDKDERELLKTVGECVRTLTNLLEPTHRDILLLVELDGLPIADAARALDISLGQAHARLDHARSALRTLLTLSCASCPHPQCDGCACDGCAAAGRKHACH